MNINYRLILFIFLTFHNFILSNIAVNILTTYYNEKDEQRINEYKYCFEKNIQNPYIKKIYVFYENKKNPLENFLQHEKITILPITHRPTFKDYIDYAAQYLSNEINIICNTDIYFDDTLTYLENYDLENKVLALTRYNIPEYHGNWERHIFSHDAWAFRTPIKHFDANIILGIPACDLRILYNLNKAGITIENPSLSIKIWHVHLSDKRNYDSKISNIYYKTKRISVPFTMILANNPRYLYAGDIPIDHPAYKTHLGLSLRQEDDHHIKHDITEPLPFPDNYIDIFQSEDVFERIEYKKLPDVINEIFRILKPNGLLRISVPDYKCDIFYKRCKKNSTRQIIFDPRGGGKLVNGKVVDGGRVWFPKIETVHTLLKQTKFYENGNIEFLHYYDVDGTPIAKKIDYAKGFIKRTPDHDPRVKNPYRPLSLVVDLYKGNS